MDYAAGETIENVLQFEEATPVDAVDATTMIENTRAVKRATNAETAGAANDVQKVEKADVENAETVRKVENVKNADAATTGHGCDDTDAKDATPEHAGKVRKVDASQKDSEVDAAEEVDQAKTGDHVDNRRPAAIAFQQFLDNLDNREFLSVARVALDIAAQKALREIAEAQTTTHGVANAQKTEVADAETNVNHDTE